MSRLVFQVGQGLGVFGDEAGASTVRVGDEFVDLTAGEYAAWLLAFAAEPWEDLRGHVEAGGDPDAAATVDRLLELGVLVACDEDNPREVFASHRLVAQGHGAGSTDDEPDVYVIVGVDGSPLARVGPATYSAWGASWLGSLWDVCEGIAEEADVPVDEVADTVAAGLPLLLSTRAATLDRWP